MIRDIREPCRIEPPRAERERLPVDGPQRLDADGIPVAEVQTLRDVFRRGLHAALEHSARGRGAAPQAGRQPSAHSDAMHVHGAAGDEGAASAAGFDDPVRGESRERLSRGVAIDLEPRGQRALRRQAIAGLQPPVRDVSAQFLCDEPPGGIAGGAGSRCFAHCCSSCSFIGRSCDRRLFFPPRGSADSILPLA